MSAPNLCPERTGMAEHCWHPTGKALPPGPPRNEKMCCYCGTTAMFSRIALYRRGGHGRFAKAKTKYTSHEVEYVGDTSRPGQERNGEED